MCFVKDPAILLKKLHFLISGCYVKEDDSTKLSFLCCRESGDAYITKRSAECEKALIEMAKEIAKEVNERHRIAASGRSAAAGLQDMQMSIHHGNSLGKTNYRPSTRTHDTLEEVQPALVIRVTRRNNLPTEDILFDMTIREPTQKLVLDQSLKQANPVKFGHASVIGWN